MPVVVTSQTQAGLANQKKFQPSGLVFVGVILVVAALVFILFLAWDQVKKYIKSIFRGPLRGPAQQLQNICDGIDPEVLEAFPIVCFSSLNESKIDMDCAVCLSLFKDNEMLRLLPSCKHGFHLHCIESWLRSHSTCPLCRRNALVMEDEST
ncbi:hypothetical protein O6H91_04G074100 [Diphasiastrum complanatum]|uniref:Uncharacterized protein n=1 Tax=Diphasiastrum complanatum TaxID=34168 RepID=A0ACC2DY14_DIPCM|nr:hypothetical protein O6H91_04G074100 [Diphasiastrum complanatum]